MQARQEEKEAEEAKINKIFVADILLGALLLSNKVHEKLIQM
jgi:hypothetical protein